jgi:thiol-disulfide isomerase/thioredoxin
VSDQGEFVNEPVWEDEDYGNGEVVHLTDDHFDSYRAEHPHLFTMFYAVSTPIALHLLCTVASIAETVRVRLVLQPWCGHCKNLKPDYVEASSQAPRSFTFAAVDCTVHTDTCNAVGTSGYPTLRYFEPLVEGSDVEAKQPAVRAVHYHW